MKARYKSGNIFTDVKVQKFPRHKFNKSYFNKFTCNHGYLIPFFVDDVVPGDRIDAKVFGRVQLQPLATSMMQNIRVYFRYFYVPYRLIWDDWDKFITQDAQSEVAFSVPTTIMQYNHLNAQASQVGNLLDMMGVGIFNPDTSTESPVDYIRFDSASALQFNLFRFGAYQLVWDYYFRDENLQEPVFNEDNYKTGHNHFNGNYSQLLPVAYEKDYFTTALPWPQKGDPVNLSAYIYANSSPFWLSDGVTNNQYGLLIGGGVRVPSSNYTFQLEEEVPIGNGSSTSLQPLGEPYTINAGSLYDDSSAISGHAFIRTNDSSDNLVRDTPLRISDEAYSTSFNINDLRYANALQRFLERKALGGSRPAEFYLSMYGVRVDDLRIGQPLYLGGGYSNVSVTDVTQMSQTTEGNPLGTLAGNGKSFPAMKMNNPYYCQEFGVVLGVMYIRPEINYSQGLPRQMQLFDTLDFYNPVFAHLGEEAVLDSELFIKPTINNVKHGSYASENNDGTFGYQSRYAYLKHRRNEVHGEFKTNLSHWLLSVAFTEQPSLNDEFITVDQNYDVFAVTNPRDHHYLVELYNNYEAESSMPNFVIPSL